MCGCPLSQDIPKWWTQEEKIKLLCMGEIFSPLHTVTSVAPVGFSSAMNLLLLLNRFAFILLGNLIMLLP